MLDAVKAAGLVFVAAILQASVFSSVREDVCAAGRIGELLIEEAAEIRVELEFAD